MSKMTKFEIEERDGCFRWVVGGEDEYYLAGEWNDTHEGAKQDGDLLRALINESVNTGAAEERVAIVHWLRARGDVTDIKLADAIERAAHHEEDGR